MPGTIFGIPFDDELFLEMWREAPDPYLTAMIESGAVVDDSTIAGMIQGVGISIPSHFTTPWMGMTRTMMARRTSPWRKLAVASRPAWYMAVQKDSSQGILPRSCPALTLWDISYQRYHGIGRNGAR